MKKLLALTALATVRLAGSGQAFTGNNSPHLQVKKVTVTNAVSFADKLKKDDHPAPNAAAYDFLMDGYAAPT